MVGSRKNLEIWVHNNRYNWNINHDCCQTQFRRKLLNIANLIQIPIKFWIKIWFYPLKFKKTSSAIMMASHRIVCVSPSLAPSLEPLADRRNVVSLSFFYRYYSERCSSELDELVPLPPSRGRSPRCSNRLHDFSVTIPGCYKDIYVNSSFPRTLRLWNSLPSGCSPLTYGLNGFKSRVNRHIFSLDSF